MSDETEPDLRTDDDIEALETEALTAAGGTPVGEDDNGDELIEGPNSQ